MRWVLFVLSLGQFAIALNAAAAERQLREVTIADPFIELHTGPGGGYPVFFVAERGEEIALIRRRTEWFLVRVARGQEGWVHFEQLATTLNPDGQPAPPTSKQEKK
ncbi:MAG: SH3 domain-containing protein, partial [Lysobacterales bacterium]